MEKTTREIDSCEDSWYVVCTAANVEEEVKKQLKQSGFETYLPLQPIVYVWGGRKKKVMLPIIPRIVFACLSKNEMKQISTLKGGFFLLQDNEKYVSVSIKQMDAFRKAMDQTNRFVKFLFEDFGTEPPLATTVDESSPWTVGEVKRILAIEGIGTVLIGVDR